MNLKLREIFAIVAFGAVMMAGGFFFGKNVGRLFSGEGNLEKTGPAKVAKFPSKAVEHIPAAIRTRILGLDAKGADLKVGATLHDLVTSGRRNPNGFLLALRSWEEKEPILAWTNILELKADLPAEDWVWLRDQMIAASRYHVTAASQKLVRFWEDPKDYSFYTATKANISKEPAKAWQQAVQKAPSKVGFLETVAANNLMGDWVNTADFIDRQPIENDKKAKMLDMVASGWTLKEGGDASSVWLLEDAKQGPVWNTPRAWTAVDRFAANPELAMRLLSRVDDPSLRSVAALTIASQSGGLAAIKSLEPLVDRATWRTITSLFGKNE